MRTSCLILTVLWIAISSVSAMDRGNPFAHDAEDTILDRSARKARPKFFFHISDYITDETCKAPEPPASQSYTTDTPMPRPTNPLLVNKLHSRRGSCLGSCSICWWSVRRTWAPETKMVWLLSPDSINGVPEKGEDCCFPILAKTHNRTSTWNSMGLYNGAGFRAFQFNFYYWVVWEIVLSWDLEPTYKLV